MKAAESSGTPSLGLIGCGAWGKNLARNFHELAALRSICETSPGLRDGLQQLYPQVVMVSSVEHLLNDPDIRQVAIAAPAVQHFSLAREALLKGKDVYVEKPFCMKASEGRELRELAEEKSAILMVGHLLQYHPAVCKLQELVQSGLFGRIFRITSRRLNLGKVRSEENAFWSLAPHDISVVLSLVEDGVPETIRSIGETYLQDGIADCSQTNMSFSNGVTAEIQVSWLHPFKEQKLCLVGEKAMAVFDDLQDWNGKLVVRKDYFSSTETEVVPLAQDEPLRRECAHFLDTCATRSTPKTNADEGIRVLEVLEAAQYSADQGGKPLVIAGT